jgi:hypothetical protein
MILNFMDANDIWYLPWVNWFVDFLLQPFGLPKVGARTLAIPTTAVKNLNVDNPKKYFSVVKKITANKTKKSNTLILNLNKFNTNKETIMMYFNTILTKTLIELILKILH